METAAIVISVVIVALVISVIIIYNGIIGASNRAQRAWSDVMSNERQKSRILDSLIEQVSSFKEYEKSLLEKVTALRTAISNLPTEADGSSLHDVKAGTSELMRGLRIAVEAYPDLKAAQIVNNLMREISDLERNVGAAVTIFNRSVEFFNNKIQMFPSSLVNGMFNHKSPLTPFSDEKASAAFDYKPNF